MIHTQDADFTLIQADVLDGLRSLPDGSVHCVVTSPPYWGLRDYSAEGQIGLEPTPDLYVARIVEVFREVRRVLRDDGTCWVNLGDSYNANTGRGFDTNQDGDINGKKAGAVSQRMAWGKPKDLVGIPWRVAFALQADGWYLRADIIWSKPNPMPESVTDRPTKAHEYILLLTKSPRYFFDQEAVRERYTDPREGGEGFRWHSERYTEQRGPQNNSAPTARGPDGRSKTSVLGADGSIQHRDGERWPHPSGRNVRSVWEIATQPYPEAHFATYPEELVRRCVLAGTSERGCCPVCGKPWEREVERGIDESRPLARQNIYPPEVTKAGQGTNSQGSSTWGHYLTSTTTGWRPGCSCSVVGDGDLVVLGGAVHVSPDAIADELAAAHLADGSVFVDLVAESGRDTDGERSRSSHKTIVSHPPIPCTVLDPFLGSGTTAYVARKHGRRSIGIELNPAYADLAARRMQQQSLFALEPSPEPLTAHKGLTGGAYNPPGQSPHSNAR